jgi:hypothetical protein
MSNKPPIQNKAIPALREKIERETGKTPEQLYEEREKRVRDTIELKEPDRVPVWIVPEPARFCGLPHSAEYYDPAAWNQAMIQLTLHFEPDLGLPGFGSSGLAWESLGVKNRLWPGGPLPCNYEYQFIEGEYMKENEYDLFLSDPSDFIVRYYLPRIYGGLEPLKRLPPLNQLFGGFEGILTLFTDPEFEQLAKTLTKATKELKDYRQAKGDLQEDMALLGFPAFSQWGGAGGAPFDTVSSFFRGMKGSMVDMYRRPEKLLQLCDMILEQRIKNAVPADPNTRGNPKRVGLPLWRGDKAFMSDKQFEKFYWPGLKKALLASIEMGYIPIPFFEDHFGERLERLLELPKGKVIALVDHSDVVRAKEVLGGHACVIGTGPASLKYASLQEVEDYYKNQIKMCKKGGGYMLNLSFPDNATLTDLKRLMNSIKEAGRY